MKTCRQCGIEKELNEFEKHITGKDGHRNICNSCMKIKKHEYFKTNYIPKPKRPPGKWSKENREVLNVTRREYYALTKDLQNEKKRNWRKSNPDKDKFQQFKDSLKRLYNLSVEQFEEMKIKQNNRCAICNNEFSTESFQKQINVDHNHETLKIRQLICLQCNHGIGFSYEDVSLIDNVISYLQTTSMEKGGSNETV
jgi:hypothetical protein